MNKLSIYQEQQILTSSSHQLVLLLYNRAILELKKALDIESWDERKPHLQKAQDILFQLMAGCVTEMELGKNFYSLYDFYARYLAVSQIRKDIERIYKTLSFLEEIRDTWKEAMEKAKVS